MKILAFGIAKDIVGGSELTITVDTMISVADLKNKLLSDFPKFGELTAFAIAVNNEYATDDEIIQPTDEVVIIPPVSGG